MTYAMQVEIPVPDQGGPGRRRASATRATAARRSRCRRPPTRRTSPRSPARSPRTRPRRTSRRWRCRRTSGRRRTSPTTPASHPRGPTTPSGTSCSRRRGYCVQFATSMAIMARTLDIPARVGVGLPARRVRPQRRLRRVRSRVARVAGAVLRGLRLGAVRADPRASRPARRRAGATRSSGSPPRTSQPDDAVPAPAPGATASTAPGSSSPSAGTQDEDQAWLPVAITVAIVLAVASLGLALVRRRTRFRAPT